MSENGTVTEEVQESNGAGTEEENGLETEEAVETKETEENDGQETDGEADTPKIRDIEEAVMDGASEYEISELVNAVGSEIRKNHVIAFVRKAEDELPGDGFSPGKDWGEEAQDRFVELGWINDDAEMTAQGASVLGHASDIISQNNGLEVALVGYLNSEGVEAFFEKALHRGPDETEDDGGFIGGLLG